MKFSFGEEVGRGASIRVESCFTRLDGIFVSVALVSAAFRLAESDMNCLAEESLVVEDLVGI